jgi:hypothetical protein
MNFQNFTYTVMLSTLLALGLAISIRGQVPSGVAMSKSALTATLVDPDMQAKMKAAVVQVTVSNVQLVEAGGPPVEGQGHLHYQVDEGPVVATTATKLGFHELTPGSHKITVMLAANNHSPLGPKEVLSVQIPK